MLGVLLSFSVIVNEVEYMVIIEVFIDFGEIYLIDLVEYIVEYYEWEFDCIVED